MAAPNETLVMEQKTAEVSNSPKNEEASDDIGNNIVNNLKSPGSNHPSKHETYQDGGRSSKTLSNANSGGDLERQRMNADYRHYNQNFITADDYRNSQENHTSNYCGNFVDRSNYLADQHGGQADQQQAQNQKMYSQYAIRQGYQSRTVNLNASHRPAVAANVMSNYPTGGATPQQQRFLTGQSISQQGGPTPTLNQLLQSPNPLHRYQNHYGDYNANKGISGSDVNSAMAFTNAGSQHGWGTVRNPSSYPQQMYRSQGGTIADPGMKRGYLSPGQQSSQQTNPQGSQQHAGQYGQQYVQRSYSQAQQQPSPARNMTPGYSQVRLPAQYNMQQVNTNSQVTQGNFDQRPLSQMASFNQPQGQVTPEVASGVDDDPGGGGGGTSTPGLTRTPGTPPTSQGQPLRPPSVSSTGSRSMSPAIGQQANIPMSPRPSSSQSDNNGQSHMTPTQMAAQNYNQQMASTQFYGNKIHQGIMGNSGPIGQYSQQGHYPQGNYPRPQSSMGLQGYGTQGQNSYPSPMNNPNYPSQTGIVRLPPSGTQNYPASTTAGFMNSQYAGPTGYGMMPPPSQYSKSTMLPPGNAQAAAQAAIVAAANSASMRSSPMYLRQHLQQKMYSGSYNSMQQQPGIPNSMPGPPTTPTPAPCGTPNASQDDSPMLPPAVSTPSSSQHSSMSPPSVSTPITETSNAVTSLSSSGFTQTSAPSIGTSSTTMTQSIESPVSSAAVTVSSPVGESYTSQQALSSQKRMMSSGFQPPPVLDEGSQASNTSASSSLPEEHATTPKPNSKSTLSHPPTPNTLPSPGAASMSSFHDEFDSVSSPSWPRTPASPVVNNQVYEHHIIKRPDGLLKLYDMSEEPDRRNFLDKLIMYNEERGTPITQCPTISKQPLDLYRLYISVKERGGFVEVTKSKQWKDVAAAVGVGASSSAAYTLRKQYIKHLLPYECKFDRGGIDPQPIINQVEAATRKKGKNSSGSGHQEAYPQPSPNQMMDGYPPSNYSGPYPPPSASHTGAGMITSGDYPSSQHPSYGQSPHHHNQMPNHMVSGSETMNMQDPFSEEIQSNQYQRSTPANNYSYSQTSINSMVPPFSGTQASMSGGSYGYTNAAIPPQQEQYGEQYSQHPNLMASADSSTYTHPRGLVQEPCNQPSGGYPPNRPLRQHTAAQYPYQGHCDRERYDQQQPAPVMQPTSQINNPLMVSNAMQGDPSLYQSQRFTAQQMSMPPRDTMTPQPPTGFQPRASMTPNQYPAGIAGQVPGQTHYSQAQPDGFRGAEVPAQYQNQMSCLQTFQRLLSKNPQQNMYGHGGPQAPAKVVTPPTANRDIYQREVYPPTPKRHMDFMKPSLPDQYSSGSYSQQAASPSPYGDRSQYGYRSSHMMPMSTSPAIQQGWSRETQYRQYQSVYPHPQRDGWDNTRPEGPNTWSHYAPPQSESYHPHMGSYSPSLPGKPMYGRDRMYIPPNKVAPSPGISQQPQFLQTPGRKEIIFPQESVEATIPLMTKRRRISSKDVTPLEAWRIMMALKSGLLAESTWALDVLSVLLYDDNTVLYFGLSHLPGLLEVLLEHYRRCLKLIFGLTGDLEVGYETRYHMDPDPEDEQERLCDRKWYETSHGPYDKFKVSGPIPISQIDNSDKTVILDKENFTQRTRCGKTVKTKNDESLFLLDPERAWDCYEGFESGMGHWHLGGGDMTCHIQTYFENTHSYVKFVRVLEDVVKSERSESRCSDDSDLPEESNKSVASSSSSDREIPVLENMQCVVENKDESEHSEERKEDDIKQEPKEEESSKENQNEEEEDDEDDKKPVLEPMKDDEYPKIRETSYPRKRLHLEDMEDEAYNRDEPSLCVITDSQISLTRRCLCLSTLFRNLSFVPGNDAEMSKHAGFLLLMGRLLLLHHHHSLKKVSQQHYDQEEELENPSASDSCSSLSSKREWWWDMLHMLRENTLVTLANITGQLDLAPYPEEISLPLLDGLLHWAVCPSTYAQDPLPSQPPHSVLSPQRLSLEALCKLSILDGNVDLLLATPPWSRIERLFSLLSRFLNYNEDQVLREFSVVLLSNLAQADGTVTRSIVTQGSCISQLILFVEQAEQNALQVANTQGINALRKNPELMGTTLDMVRRAAGTLRCLARIPENKPLFLQHHQRLLALVMSQILDQGVASIVADVLYECSQDISDFGSSATHSFTKS
ncbi:AT-rich interactive domain-containing protein 1B-like isoform X3 [Centruroides sculpturatus]|uniref:AT-rich interactive domain-containing protein 1B-like isoform X3 n=1 Tax=Centruroides sculpturatus TaxID=218467 RepID=UPI000C6D54ED|nr:AT-rich interactive domain-containing protein 1B-like isoform X3 [Centruroides sculpturatus]